MGKSLQDQLLGAGLANKKQAQQATAEKRRKNKQKQKNRKPAVDPQRLQAQKELEQNKARDRELNRKQTEDVEKRAEEAQIRQLIENHRVPREEGDIPYNFADDKKVVRIHLSAVTRERITRGSLAIVGYAGKYELIPIQIAEKIRIRNEKIIVVCNDLEQSEGDTDDPYSEYQIPDDLMW